MTYDARKLNADLYAAEGLRFFPYDDATGQPIAKGSHVLGFPSIGVGRNMVARPLTQQVVDLLLHEDVVVAETGALEIFPDLTTYSDARQRAIVEMVFNLGHGGANAFFQFRHYIEAGQWQQAGQSLFASRWAQQAPDRVKRIAAQIATGEDPHGSQASKVPPIQSV